MAKEKRLFDTDSEDDDKEYKPSNKKVIESSDEEDESSEEETLAKKTAVKKVAASGDKRKRESASANRDANGNQIFELSSKRRVTVRAFSDGTPSVDIREVYEDKSGTIRPGKGICFPIAQWKKLVELLPEIDEAIADLPNKKK